jgi:hypothetical protein
MLTSQDLQNTLARAIDPDAFASGDVGRMAVANAAAARACTAMRRFVRLLISEGLPNG